MVEREAAPPTTGLQDTVGGGNRVLCKPSGAGHLAIRTEQKSGHSILLQIKNGDIYAIIKDKNKKLQIAY